MITWLESITASRNRVMDYRPRASRPDGNDSDNKLEHESHEVIDLCESTDDDISQVEILTDDPDSSDSDSLVILDQDDSENDTTTVEINYFTRDTLDPAERNRNTQREPSESIEFPKAPTVFAESCALGEHEVLKPGDTVELKGKRPYRFKELRSGPFFYIVQCLHNLETDEKWLRGYKMIRLFRERTLFHNPHMNELTLSLRVNADNYRPQWDQSLVDITLDSVIRKRELIFTELDYPALSWRGVEGLSTPKEDVYHFGRLCCRHVHVRIFKNASQKEGTSPIGGEVRKLLQEEINSLAQRDKNIRSFRSLSIECLQQPVLRIQPAERYGFADLFCGAGGASCGARKAGLEVKFAVDINREACQTYEENFPDTALFQLSIDKFLSLDLGIQVDILHISPPCQPHSPAQTRQGVHNEANQAALYCVIAAIKKLRPRIVTMEETSGLAYMSKSREHFRALLAQFNAAGYSVKWKVMNGAELGLPQQRKRLILVAAAPGIPLPSFPSPTHGTGPNMRPFVTVHECVSQIPANATENEPNPFWRRNMRMPYDPRTTQLKGLITCGGGESYHWTGRSWTVRELATLQTFPHDFAFAGISRTAKIQQIGNAFAPLHAAALFEECVRTLQEVDGQGGQVSVANEPGSEAVASRNTGSYNNDSRASNIALVLDD